ncbi:hypothetical protein [Leptospira weilii]|uniref:hypothetical protein n=1 Tax=Leptospira weilii TaxID=28184 RepID=UPI0002E333C2|nr:hypothetical protein [Leptospira weilii]
MKKPQKTSQLKYAPDGWATLANGVQVHQSGQGQVVLRSSGLYIPQKINLASSSGGATQVDESSPYVEFQFRMLSKTLIEGYWIDFSKDNVLKDALNLFETKIFKDHETNVENSIGHVLNPIWSNSQKLEGIDGTYRIFKAFGASIIDRLVTDPPILDSTSVGIRFTYERSHPDLDYFYSNLGREIDGHVVRFIITKILSVPETSIVYAGADPNAKRLSIHNTSYHFNEDINSSDLGEEEIQTEENNMKLNVKLITALGVALESLGLEKQGEEVELTQEKAEVIFKQMGSKVSSLETSLSSYAGLTNLDKFPAGFDHKANVANLKSLLEEPNKILEFNRSEVLKAYRLFVNGKADSTIEDLINNADLKQVKALGVQYGIKLEEKFPKREDELGNPTRASGQRSELSETDEIIII